MGVFFNVRCWWWSGLILHLRARVRKCEYFLLLFCLIDIRLFVGIIVDIWYNIYENWQILDWNSAIKIINKSTKLSQNFKQNVYQKIKKCVLLVRRLTTLTSIIQENKSTRTNDLYPKHALALEKAGLITPAEYPTLQEYFDQIEQ